MVVKRQRVGGVAASILGNLAMLGIITLGCSPIVALAIALSGQDDSPSAFLYLGFDAKDFSELADQPPYSDLKSTKSKGIVAEFVYRDSQAYRSGLRSGDVIASAGKKPIEDKKAFEAWFADAADGQGQPIVVYRHFPNQKKKWQSATIPLSILKDPKFADATRGAKSLTRVQPGAAPEPTGLQIALDERVFYIPKGRTTVELSFARITLGRQEPTEGFFRIGDKAERLRLKSDAPRVVRVYGVGDEIRDGYKVTAEYAPAFFFAGPGTATITAEVADLAATAKITVVEIPVSISDESQTVIETLGLPDSKEDIFVEWPESEVIDNILYEPRPNKLIKASHWRYAKYPGAVLSIVDGKLFKIATSSKRGD